mmetsp:Transcript_386/g.1512  ORF Transcript_386/g.1512 Transcript_386/m.1512 type:complete len:213 (-) Transcript_386:1590-2228(-)
MFRIAFLDNGGGRLICWCANTRTVCRTASVPGAWWASAITRIAYARRSACFCLACVAVSVSPAPPPVPPDSKTPPPSAKSSASQSASASASALALSAAGGRGTSSRSAANAAAHAGGSTVPVSGSVDTQVGPPVVIQLHTVSPASAPARAVLPSKPPSGGHCIAAAAPRKYRRSSSCHATSPLCNLGVADCLPVPLSTPMTPPTLPPPLSTK